MYYYYGDNLLLSDNPDSAKIFFDKGILLDANNPLIKIGKAKILLDKFSVREAKFSSEKDGANTELRDRYEQSMNNVKEAERLIDEAVLNTKDINVLIEAAEALIHYNNKNTDKAKTLLDKAAGMDSKNIEVLLLCGDLYAELNNGTLSADYYNRSLDIDKTSARAIVSKGKLYMRSTNYDGAAREFQDAIALEPSYAPAYRELGEAYIKIGKLKEAKEAYKKYLELSKNNCGARIRYATFLYVAKNYTEALTELEQVKQRCDSNNLRMLRILSYSYFELKDSVNILKGIKTIEKLFSLVPPEKRTSKDYEIYGKLLSAAEQDSLGLEQLQKAFALEPTRSDLLSEMATIWIKLKQYPNAIQMLTQKISIGKDVKVADHYLLARAYYFNMQFVEADSAVAKVNELSPKYYPGWSLRAQINAQIDSTSEAGLAKPYYEKYIEIALADSANPAFVTRYNNGLTDAYTYLAYYYLLKKDTANSLIFLKKKLGLQIDPEERKNVQQAIERLEGRGIKPKK